VLSQEPLELSLCDAAVSPRGPEGRQPPFPDPSPYRRYRHLTVTRRLPCGQRGWLEAVTPRLDCHVCRV
jgi:hypothetical protein